MSLWSASPTKRKRISNIRVCFNNEGPGIKRIRMIERLSTDNINPERFVGKLKGNGSMVLMINNGDVQIQQIKEERVATCPLCRIEATVPGEQKLVIGNETECNICLDQMSQIYFSQCGHVCCCEKMFC